MFEWSDEHLQLRHAVRRFVQAEIAPVREELEGGSLPPYDIIRRFYKTFALEEVARDRFERQLAGDGSASDAERFERAVMTLLPMVEICRYSTGLVTAMGVSANLTAGTIMKRGTDEQRRRWALDLLTFDKVGAWALTEPDSGSDAFGAMRASARRDGDGYVLNGAKTFITNGPYADTIVFMAKLHDGDAAASRPVLSFVLDRGMDGVEQTAPLRKMGLHSSPTGEIFVSEVRVDRDRLLGESESAPAGGRSSARAAFASERASIAAMALGMIQQSLELCCGYARDRVQFGRRIGDFQLIQQKLAWMEIARLNVENLLFRYLETLSAGRAPTLAEASAMKLYSARAAAEVTLEAVQLFGGNGYMWEFQVEQLARDAKVLQIYAGTDEMQTIQIARDLLS
jgi:acyl-CoA dehydrogenase